MAVPVWTRIDPLTVDDQRYRVVIQELWRTDSLTLDVPPGDELIGSVPVQINQLHSDPTWAARGCQCISKRLVYGPIRRVAKVLVTYDSNIRFGFGYYPRTNKSNKSLRMPWYVPVLKASGTSSLNGTVGFVERPFGMRPAMRRIFTKDITGDSDQIAAAIVENLNKRYFLRLRNGAAGPPSSVDGDDPVPDGIQIVLQDFSVTDLGNQYNRVVYEFMWYGPVRAIAGTDVGSLCNYPALNELDVYDFPFDNPASAVGLTIPKIDGLKLYLPGGTLP